MIQKKINIENRKARFHYELLDTYEAGIQLFGTEIKSIRLGKAGIAESFCQLINGEMFIVNMYIEEYSLGTHANHRPRRDRKLLLKKNELAKLERKTKETGLTIVATKLYINDCGLAKIRISLAKGKKIFDKRNTLKEKDLTKDLQRITKNY